MRPHPRAYLLLAFTLMAAAVSVSTNDTIAQPARTITVEGQADGDGGVIKGRVMLKKGSWEVPYDFSLIVFPKEDPTDKADRIAGIIDKSAHLDASAEGNVVTIELGDNSPFEDIGDIKITEITTGEHHAETMCDSVPEDSIYTAFFDIEGTGGTPGAQAVLRIGDYGPMVYTSTDGRTADEIEADLVDTFNVAYYGTGYTAQYVEGEIIIDSVPCVTGIAAGSDDSLLTWTVGLRSLTPRAILPGLSTWGLIILSIVVLVSGIWLYRRRRIRLARSC